MTSMSLSTKRVEMPLLVDNGTLYDSDEAYVDPLVESFEHLAISLSLIERNEFPT